MAKKIDDLIEKYGIDTSGDCWLWTRSLDGSGYGNLSVNGRMWRAHRFFYYEAFGIDPTGCVVMHKCDEPKCVNPRHLILGTQRDNIRDRHEKGRSGACRGDSAPWSILTSERVADLRERFESGENRQALATEFGVSKTQIYRVIKRESWRHI